jgi:hypothetical protein
VPASNGAPLPAIAAIDPAEDFAVVPPSGAGNADDDLRSAL